MLKSRRPPKRSAGIKRSPVKKRNPKRRKSEFARCYHSKARVEFVKSLECSACQVVGYSDNAHIRTGGMGRKASYKEIIPLCHMRITKHELTTEYYIGCHVYYDEQRYNFDIAYPNFEPEIIAAQTERAWRASQGETE